MAMSIPRYDPVAKYELLTIRPHIRPIEVEEEGCVGYLKLTFVHRSETP